jgi:hypothetical protein
VRAGDRPALSEAGLHPRFPSELKAVEFKLSDAQFVVARQQGFAGWNQLKAAIDVVDTPTGALPMKMNYLTPELPVPNIDEALATFEALGFRRAWRYEDSFACMYGGGSIEIFFRHHSTPQPVTLYLKVDNADSFYEVYRQHTELVEPIRDTPWGMREFAVRTVGNHVLRIGHGESAGGDRRSAV